MSAPLMPAHYECDAGHRTPAQPADRRVAVKPCPYPVAVRMECSRQAHLREVPMPVG